MFRNSCSGNFAGQIHFLLSSRCDQGTEPGLRNDVNVSRGAVYCNWFVAERQTHTDRQTNQLQYTAPLWGRVIRQCMYLWCQYCKPFSSKIFSDCGHNDEILYGLNFWDTLYSWLLIMTRYLFLYSSHSALYTRCCWYVTAWGCEQLKGRSATIHLPESSSSGRRIQLGMCTAA